MSFDTSSYTTCFSAIDDPELAQAELAKLPASPGVYLFFGKQDNLLYVGKSIDLRARVRSHYYARHSDKKEQRLIHQTCTVKYQQTDGELGALLLESQLVKQLMPLHNRRLRRTRKLHRLVLTLNDAGYFTASVSADATEDEANFGTFSSPHKARDYLRKLATDLHLCTQVLGLDNGKGRCFAHQLKRCSGACIGEQSTEDFNGLLLDALSGEKLQDWPYAGLLWVGEPDEHEQVNQWHLVDRWHYRGTARTAAEARALSNAKLGAFDRDSYHILLSQLRSNPKLIMHPAALPPLA